MPGQDAAPPGPRGPLADVRPVTDDQWEIVAWLWQAFRQDLAVIVHGLPYGNGRYQAAPLDAYPCSDGAGYLAWRPHPKTGEEAPVAFALVDGLDHDGRSMVGFWVAPAARREGVGDLLALEVLRRHDGPWSIGLQHDNAGAFAFWHRVADTAFGPGLWREERRGVPGLPDVAADHIIHSS